jgi:outer membrane protein, multidrug efflux system
MKKLIFSQLAIVILLSSCLVGKRYIRPAMDVPSDYMHRDSVMAAVDTSLPTDTVINLQWFQLFHDTILNALINQALDTNTDLRIATLRVQQSRAVFKNTRANLLPSIGYTGSAEINDPNDDYFDVLGTASWEIDFWGKLRRAKRAAQAEMIASQEGLKTVKTTIVSDVATLYFLMRDLDNRIDVARQTLASRTTYYNMVNERFLKGEAAELDKLQAEQQLALVEATINSLQRDLNYTERSLNVLLGEKPQAIPRGMQNDQQATVPVIPSSLPSTLLERRPDVKAAEEILIAETEKIGVAQAMRLPSFNLTAFFGVANTNIDDLFAEGSVTSNLTGLITGPLFEFGKNKRRVDIQRAEAEIAVNNYLNTYRTALGDVENALLGIKSYQAEYAARLRQVAAARKALMLTKAKYDNGYSSYLDVLIAESYAFDAEMFLSMTRAQQLGATVSLYRALGGGWQ